MFDWAIENRVTARELAMLRVMNSITDKLGWETKVFDDEIAALWKAEAIASEEMISWRAWAWCLEELRDKAIEFSKTGRVAVYDVGPSISKSCLDVRGGALKGLVQDGIDRAVFGDCTHEWQLDSDSQVLNMVDPSLYPLAYGITKVLPEGEEVDLGRPWDKIDQGLRSVVAPHALDKIFLSQGLDPEKAPEILRERDKLFRWEHSSRWSEDMPWRYSNRFQWLPCDVKFTDPDTQDDCRVKIEGYVNNLHSTSHGELYAAIEDVISASIQPWNDTVTCGISGGDPVNGRQGKPKVGLGRAAPRIRTFSLCLTMPLPPNGICWREEGNFYKELWDLSDSWDTLEPAKRNETLQGIIARMDSAEDLMCPIIWCPSPENPTLCQEILFQLDKFYQMEPEALYSYQDWKSGRIPPMKIDWDSRMPGDSSSEDEEVAKERKIKEQRQDEQLAVFYDGLDITPLELQKLCHHCPCSVFGDDWKLCRERDAKSVVRSPGVANMDHEYRHVQLQRDFRSQGLQVFVKMQSIQLGPERPCYDGSDWTLEGLLNEHIIANSIYFFDVENVRDLAVSFRVQAGVTVSFPAPPGSEHRRRMTSMYAMDDLVNHDGDDIIPHMQTLGSVTVSEGRFIAFPNTLQYRMGPVKLLDSSKPGHVRFLTLCLVDPNYRIVSTKRVVPQRFYWWMQDVFPWVFLMGKGLPVDVVEKIAHEARGEHIITPTEARAFRTRILRERERMMAELNCSIYHYHFRDPPSPADSDAINEYLWGDWRNNFKGWDSDE